MSRSPSSKESRVAFFERALLRAAYKCINRQGHAYTIATEGPAARTFFVNEKAFQRLERAVANLKAARRSK